MSIVCKAMEDMRNEALERGREEKLIENIKSLMQTLKFTAQQAIDALRVPLNKQNHYIAKL